MGMCGFREAKPKTHSVSPSFPRCLSPTSIVRLRAPQVKSMVAEEGVGNAEEGDNDVVNEALEVMLYGPE